MIKPDVKEKTRKHILDLANQESFFADEFRDKETWGELDINKKLI